MNEEDSNSQSAYLAAHLPPPSPFLSSPNLPATYSPPSSSQSLLALRRSSLSPPPLSPRRVSLSPPSTSPPSNSNSNNNNNNVNNQREKEEDEEEEATESGKREKVNEEEKRNGKFLAELQQLVKIEIARTYAFETLMGTINKSLDEKQKEIKELWLRIGCLQREITKVILNKKIESCVINPVIADVPYSVSSALSQLISFLRITPSLLAKAVRFRPDNLKLLATFVVHGMFRPYVEHDEILLLNFIKQLMEDEFAEEDYQLHLSLLNPMSIFDLILRSYFKVCGVNEYFTVLFGDIVASILQEHSAQACSATKIAEFVANFESIIKWNVNSMPYAFRWIILQLKRCMINKGIPDDEISTGIGKFIFYYVFERGLNKPEYTGYMLFTRIGVTSIARDNMAAITQQLRKRMESPNYALYIESLLQGIVEPSIMFSEALKQALFFRNERMLCYLTKEAINVITKPLYLIRNKARNDPSNASQEDKILESLLGRFEEKQKALDKLKEDDHVEFEMSVKQEQQRLGLIVRPEGAKQKRAEPSVKDAMTKLKGLFALPSKITAWDDADVVTTLRRFIITNWKSSTIIAAIEATILALEMLPERYKVNDYDKLLKKLQKKTAFELEKGFAVIHTDTLMTVLDVAHRQTQTLTEVQERLLEFFTSLKLVLLESVRNIIAKGVDEFKALPKAKICACVVFETKCHACALRSDLMHAVMVRVAAAIEKSPMWQYAERAEKAVAERACERSLVDQIPREILMPQLKADVETTTQLLANEPLSAKDCGIG
jgi:hypothetical protein